MKFNKTFTLAFLCIACLVILENAETSAQIFGRGCRRSGQKMNCRPFLRTLDCRNQVQACRCDCDAKPTCGECSAYFEDGYWRISSNCGNEACYCDLPEEPPPGGEIGPKSFSCIDPALDPPGATTFYVGVDTHLNGTNPDRKMRFHVSGSAARGINFKYVDGVDVWEIETTFTPGSPICMPVFSTPQPNKKYCRIKLDEGGLGGINDRVVDFPLTGGTYEVCFGDWTLKIIFHPG